MRWKAIPKTRVFVVLHYQEGEWKKFMVLGIIKKKDLDQVGEKANNLSSMAEIGFPVPGGFVIPIDAHNRCLEKLGLGRAFPP